MKMYLGEPLIQMSFPKDVAKSIWSTYTCILRLLIEHVAKELSDSSGIKFKALQSSKRSSGIYINTPFQANTSIPSSTKLAAIL
jgi:hypothetical protein